MRIPAASGFLTDLLQDLIRFLLEHRVANITTRKPKLALKLRDEIQGSPASHGLLPDGSIEEIIREGAKIMIEADAHRLHVKQKAGTANFVTEYDVRVQHFLEEKLKALIPECEFLAEEEGESDNPVGDGYTFVIDPIKSQRRRRCIYRYVEGIRLPANDYADFIRPIIKEFKRTIVQTFIFAVYKYTAETFDIIEVMRKRLHLRLNNTEGNYFLGPKRIR